MAITLKWTVVKNYEEFKLIVESCFDRNVKFKYVSFDHDLAEQHYTPEKYWDNYQASEKYQNAQKYTEKTGEDCAKYMKEIHEKFNTPLPIIYVHSMNPVGAQRIINVFK